MEPGGKRRRSRRESKSFYHIEFGNQDSSLQNLRRPSTTVTFITSLKVTKQTPRVSAASNEENVENQVGDVGHLSPLNVIPSVLLGKITGQRPVIFDANQNAITKLYLVLVRVQ